jgi:hypothetical protein
MMFSRARFLSFESATYQGAYSVLLAASNLVTSPEYSYQRL